MQHHTPHWHRGLHALHFGFLSGLIAVTLMGTTFVAVLSPLWVERANAAVTRFAPGSFWDTAIPAYTDLDPNSDALIAEVVSQVNSYGDSIAKDEGSGTVYEVDSSAPTVSVMPYDCGNGVNSGLTAQWSAVPIPFYAVPGGSANPQMVIYRPSTGTVWELGHVRNISGQWQACTGGQISTTSSGVFPSPYGLTTSGLAMLGGQLSIQELTAGTISHAVGLTLPKTNGISWPASQSNGSSADAPAMGQRLRLDPNINVDGLGLSPAARAIARAAQTYGLIVWNGGPTVGFTAEDSVSSTSRGLPDPYTGVLNAGTLNGFPWTKLQALPANYGQSTGVPTITQFSASPASVAADSRVTLTWRANNVSRCAIGGLSDNLGSQGSLQTGPLQAGTTFILRCGGPLGTTTSQLNITVSSTTSNDVRRTLGPGSLIDQPYSGYANVLPELMNVSGDGVYKVVYYNQKTYVSETATPPFALNTLRLPNGKYTITAKIYYQDGHVDQRVLGVAVSNSPEVLPPLTQSNAIKTPPSIPVAWGILGGLSAITVMGAGTWWGWRRAHLF